MRNYYLVLIVFQLILAKFSICLMDENFPCYDETWLYSNLTGKCYKAIQYDRKFSYRTATENCNTALIDKATVKVGLIEFYNEHETDAVVKLLYSNGFKETIWIGAKRSNGSMPFIWEKSKDTANFDFLEWSGGQNSGDCIEFSYSAEPITGSDEWFMIKNIENKDCGLLKSVVCEHTVPLCNNPQGGFNSSTMEFSPSIPAPGAIVKVVCKTGTIRETMNPSKLHTDFYVDTSLESNTYKCVGTRVNRTLNPADPSLLQSDFYYSGYDLAPCSYTRCPLYPDLLDHIENKPSVPSGSDSLMFDFGQNITFQCSRGYVSFQDSNNTSATMVCSHTRLPASQGLWTPENYQACVAIRCDDTLMKNMVPKNAKLISARNRLTDQVFGSHQVNQFNIYGNVINIRCNPGYIFSDRTFEKSISCELVENSDILGEFRGYSGTILPIPNKCEEATCLYEEAVIQSDFNMKPNFVVTLSNKQTLNLTRHLGVPYLRGTSIQYFCENGYESVNQHFGFNITCGDYGQWTPQLIGCIPRVEKIPVTSDGRMRIQPKEAKSATQISSIMFILVFIFLGFILLLDLITLARDFKQLRKNIILQKKRFELSRNKRNKLKNDSNTNDIIINNNNDNIFTDNYNSNDFTNEIDSLPTNVRNRIDFSQN